jgi:hypothetical protein
MINRALRKKDSVEAFLDEYRSDLGLDNVLDDSDWSYLERTHAFLQPFTEATLWAEGKSTLSQSLLLMDALLSRFEKFKVYSQFSI